MPGFATLIKKLSFVETTVGGLSGFTLLETLISISLSGASLLLLFGMLGTVQAAYVKNTNSVSERQELAAASQLMTREMAEADVVRIVALPGNKTDRDIILEFPESAGIRYVKYHLASYAGDPTLIHRDVDWPGDNYGFTGHNPVAGEIVRLWFQRDQSCYDLVTVTMIMERGDHRLTESKQVYCRNAFNIRP